MDGKRAIALAVLLLVALSACRAIPGSLLDDEGETASEDGQLALIEPQHGWRDEVAAPPDA